MSSTQETTLLSPVNNNLYNARNYSTITIPTEAKMSRLNWFLSHRREILVVTLAGIAYTPLASVIAYSSPALPHLQAESEFYISDEMGSWFTSLGSLGAAGGTLIGGPLANCLGRKMSLLTTLLALLLSWLLMIWSTNRLWVLFLGRILTGITSGTLLVIIPIYVAEIVSAGRRGTFQSITALIYQLGYVFTYLVGAYTSFQWLTVACMAHVALTTFGIPFLPESPRWLLSRNRQEEAKDTLVWLRQTDDIYLELIEIKESLAMSKNEANQQKVDLSSARVYRPLLLSVGLMVILVSTGIDVVLFYTVTIFQQVNNTSGTLKKAPTFDPYIETVVVGVSGVFGVIASSYFVDKCGRKPILMVSGALIALSMGILGAFFKLLESDGSLIYNYDWIPMVCLVCFLISYNVGWGGVPYALSAEMLPTEARALGSGLCFTLMWILGFLWTKGFVFIQTWIHIYGMFWVFTASGVIGILYVHFLIPETNGKTLEQIERMFSVKY